MSSRRPSFSWRQGRASLRREDGDRRESVEAAITYLQRAGPLTTGEEEAEVMMELAGAGLERLEGDPAENRATAIELMRSGVEVAEASAPPEILAMYRTNLASALLEAEQGDRIAELREGVTLCRAALEYRSPERNATDWAFSKLNLAACLQNLASRDEGDYSDAEEAYRRVIAEADRVEEPWVVGSAHVAIARMKRAEADRLTEVDLENEEEPDPADEARREAESQALYEEARGELELALPLNESDPNGVRRGRALDQLAGVLIELDDESGAIDAGSEAVRYLRPETAPRESADAAGRLANLLAEREDWPAAARFFAEAIEGSNIAFHARLEDEAREREATGSGNLGRWGAYAIARAGDPLAAALALENTRARDLRRRLGLPQLDRERMEELDPELLAALAQATDAVAAAPIGAAGSGVTRRLQEVIEAIRFQEGFRDFGFGLSAEDLSAALEAGFPLVYIDPTPYGTLLLILELADSSEVTCSAVFLDDVRAIDVFMRLTAGDVDRPEGHGSSYFFGIGGGADRRDFRASLDQSLPWLGESIAVEVAKLLRDAEARGATLVLSGPLAAAPLHAARWDEDGHSRCLLDEFEIRFVPSAAFAGEALRRADSSGEPEPRLVALANPSLDLVGAELEVEVIASRFPGTTEVAIRRRADRAFLRAHASQATHLHLACHAQSSLFERGAADIGLEDGPLNVSEIPGAATLTTRLVTLSACQSAVAEIAKLSDEPLSIATGVLAAGSACAIATLWKVNDLVTAMLMIRLYEEMFEHGHRPPEALRRAQNWLRELTADERADFLAAHPSLEAEFASRNAPGEGAPNGGNAPCSHPYYWAPFVAVGA